MVLTLFRVFVLVRSSDLEYSRKERSLRAMRSGRAVAGGCGSRKLRPSGVAVFPEDRVFSEDISPRRSSLVLSLRCSSSLTVSFTLRSERARSSLDWSSATRSLSDLTSIYPSLRRKGGYLVRIVEKLVVALGLLELVLRVVDEDLQLLLDLPWWYHPCYTDVMTHLVLHLLQHLLVHRVHLRDCVLGCGGELAGALGSGEI